MILYFLLQYLITALSIHVYDQYLAQSFKRDHQRYLS